MAVGCAAPWSADFIEKTIAAMNAHFARYDSDPAYRKETDDRAARREAAYKERVTVLDALVAAGKSWPP